MILLYLYQKQYEVLSSIESLLLPFEEDDEDDEEDDEEEPIIQQHQWCGHIIECLLRH